MTFTPSTEMTASRRRAQLFRSRMLYAPVFGASMNDLPSCWMHRKVRPCCLISICMESPLSRIQTNEDRDRRVVALVDVVVLRSSQDD